MDHKYRTIADLIKSIKNSFIGIGKWKLKNVIPLIVILVIIITTILNWHSILGLYTNSKLQRNEKIFQDNLSDARTICFKDNHINQEVLNKLLACIDSSYMESKMSFSETFRTPFAKYFSLGLPAGSTPSNIDQVHWNNLYNGCLGEMPVDPAELIPSCDYPTESVTECIVRQNEIKSNLSHNTQDLYQANAYITKEKLDNKINSYSKLTDNERNNLKSYISCMWDSVAELK